MTIKQKRLLIMRDALNAYKTYKALCKALGTANKAKDKANIGLYLGRISKVRNYFWDLALQERMLRVY